MIHRINVFLLSLIIAFAPAYVMAVELPPNNSWSWKHHNKQRQQKRLLAHLTKIVNEAGSKKTIEAVVETTPTASKVGGSMFKRVMATGGGQMIGVMAVVQLIEAIGWVMEDGTYVKKIITEGVPNCGANFYYKNKQVFEKYGNSSLACTPAQAKSSAQMFLSSISNSAHRVTTCDYNTIPDPTFIQCKYAFYGNDSDLRSMSFPRETHNEKPADEKTVPLTPVLLGAAMLGKGYEDPDPHFNNDTVNTDQWTGVPQAYTPDSSGVGNELAYELERKADAAPRTPNGKPAPIGSPAYPPNPDSSPDSDDDNDRSWENKDQDGTKGTIGSQPDDLTDPSNPADPSNPSNPSDPSNPSNPADPSNPNSPAQSPSSFNLPRFCDWAMSVCEWLDWTQQDDLPEKDETDLKVETPLELQNYSVSWNAQCPESQTVNVGFHGITNEITIINWAFVCSMDYIIKPAVIAFASLSGLYIILGTHRRESD